MEVVCAEAAGRVVSADGSGVGAGAQGTGWTGTPLLCSPAQKRHAHAGPGPTGHVCQLSPRIASCLGVSVACPF